MCNLKLISVPRVIHAWELLFKTLLLGCYFVVFLLYPCNLGFCHNAIRLIILLCQLLGWVYWILVVELCINDSARCTPQQGPPPLEVAVHRSVHQFGLHLAFLLNLSRIGLKLKFYSHSLYYFLLLFHLFQFLWS